MAKRRHIKGLIQGSLFDQSAPVVEILMKKGGKFRYSRDDAKKLAAGFHLVKYLREEKEIYMTCNDPMRGWFLYGKYKTYAEAEKVLEHLKENVTCATGKNLYAAGFRYYRLEGVDHDHTRPRIKIGPNWSTWKKFDNASECLQEWDTLMREDDKALEG